MIAFDLECPAGHIFEGWFNNLQSFEEQSAAKLISCPYCNATEIRRVPSPVAMKSSSQKVEKDNPDGIDYQRLAKEIVHYVNKNFEDVGSDFTKEALKMHYGVTEKKNIRGSATEHEETLLKDEGIQFFKIPVPKIGDDEKD